MLGSVCLPANVQAYRTGVVVSATKQPARFGRLGSLWREFKAKSDSSASRALKPDEATGLQRRVSSALLSGVYYVSLLCFAMLCRYSVSLFCFAILFLHVTCRAGCAKEKWPSWAPTFTLFHRQETA